MRIAHRRLTGEAGGAGIVLWPKDLRDLHWWVFGETHYVSGNVGYPLGPHDRSIFARVGRPFLKTDGLSTA
jgi:hypothetical protein